MNNNNKQSAINHESPYRSRLLAMLVVFTLSGCGKSPDRPMPPQGPPKPKVTTNAFSSDVQRAVFSSSSKPAGHFQNGQGVKIVRDVIHT